MPVLSHTSNKQHDKRPVFNKHMEDVLFVTLGIGAILDSFVPNQVFFNGTMGFVAGIAVGNAVEDTNVKQSISWPLGGLGIGYFVAKASGAPASTSLLLGCVGLLYMMYTVREHQSENDNNRVSS